MCLVVTTFACGASQGSSGADDPGSGRRRRGTIPSSELQRVLSSGNPKYRDCHDKAYFPGTRPGKVRIVSRVTIGPDGDVESVKEEPPASSATQVAECVRDALKSLHFPKPHPQGSTVEVVYPVAFESRH